MSAPSAELLVARADAFAAGKTLRDAWLRSDYAGAAAAAAAVLAAARFGRLGTRANCSSADVQIQATFVVDLLALGDDALARAGAHRTTEKWVDILLDSIVRVCTPGLGCVPAHVAFGAGAE